MSSLLRIAAPIPLLAPAEPGLAATGEVRYHQRISQISGGFIGSLEEGAALFADGFESGDSDAWSDTLS